MARACLLSFLVLYGAAPAAAQGCVEDEELARAAVELLLAGDAPDADAVRRATRAAGSQLPVVSALVTPESASARRRDFVRGVRRRGHAPVRCGEARAEGRVLLLVGPAAGELWRDGRSVRVDLADGWREPVLYARDADGRVWTGAGDRVELPGDLAEPIALQLVATGPDGPRPVAEERAQETTPERARASGDPRARLAALRGDRSLRDNRLLRRVADRHARQICERGRVAHVSDGGDPRERLAREGIRARHVGETASRAADASRAFSSMLQSTSHRAALSDRRFTDVGVGEAHDAEGRTCLVVLLAAWPRAVPYR